MSDRVRVRRATDGVGWIATNWRRWRWHATWHEAMFTADCWARRQR